MKKYESPRVEAEEFSENDVMSASVPFDPIEDNPDE